MPAPRQCLSRACLLTIEICLEMEPNKVFVPGCIQTQLRRRFSKALDGLNVVEFLSFIQLPPLLAYYGVCAWNLISKVSERRTKMIINIHALGRSSAGINFVRSEESKESNVTAKTTTPMMIAVVILRTGDKREVVVAGLNNSSSVSVWLESSPYSRSSFSSSMVDWRRKVVKSVGASSGSNVWADMETLYYTMVPAVPSLGVALLVADHGSVMAPRTNARPPEAIRSNWLADIFRAPSD